jgi:hypothetical protein
MSDKSEQGYMRVRATELPESEQARLRNVLRQELAEALVKAVRAEPPEVDLAQVDLVLRPGQALSEWDVVANCGTCSTCGTCGTCSTCGTAALASDLPIGVIRDLGMAVTRPQIDARNLQRNLDRINEQLSSITRGKMT